MNASAWGAGDFEAGLSEAIGQARKLFRHAYSAAGMPWEGPGGPGHGHHPDPDEEPESHGHHPGPESHEHRHGGGRRRTAPGGGPWGGFGMAKDWMGFFGGPRGGWWPGPPGPPGPRGPHGGPGWAPRPKASRGDVRATILALLSEGPRTGYQIMSDIEERSEGAWRPSPGAVYPALQQLADEGLIIGEEAGGRRTFSLTDAGREYVADNPEMARGAWESMADASAGAHAGVGDLHGLFAEAARLGGAIAQMAHAGTPAQIREAEQLIKRTRRTLYEFLAAGDTDEESGGSAE
ncbi:MAG TPA: PadR family transcriptional regulator [Streptosporangiaceae bacterium]|jgi:DNA-binding PadR family transcriptional regulator|nr:PadR family transcriptional regulator [Streptosporangiaceae bacterium]